MKVSAPAAAPVAAFTLIEIMMVVVIVALVVGMGVPSIVSALKAEGLRKAVNDVMDGCARARAEAILTGNMAELHYRPETRQLTGGKFSAQLPVNVMVEMWDVNLIEFKDADQATVRFYPNGMCDEMTVILRSDKGEWRKISLEITTGLATVGNVR